MILPSPDHQIIYAVGTIDNFIHAQYDFVVNYHLLQMLQLHMLHSRKLLYKPLFGLSYQLISGCCNSPTLISEIPLVCIIVLGFLRFFSTKACDHTSVTKFCCTSPGTEVRNITLMKNCRSAHFQYVHKKFFFYYQYSAKYFFNTALPYNICQKSIHIYMSIYLYT